MSKIKRFVFVIIFAKIKQKYRQKHFISTLCDGFYPSTNRLPILGNDLNSYHFLLKVEK